MKQKTTLLVLAAGMGSRYGGLKQIDPLGPNGEIIIDYSLHDAYLAGFDKVVFVIKRELEETFRQLVGDKLAGKLEVAYAYQELSDLPGGFVCPEGRVKPWGTGHAVYAARNVIDGPFGVIGSDDFFGRDTFLQLHGFVSGACDASHLCMVGFRLDNTLTENGTVSRGVCVTKDGMLQSVTERTQILRTADSGICYIENDVYHPLPADAVVSMNVWGFHSDIFALMEQDFTAWLQQGEGDPMKREYYLPAFVDRMIRCDRAQVTMLTTASRWYGVTHKEDKEKVMAALQQMHDNGEYPKLA